MANKPRGLAFDSESGREAQAKRGTKSGGKSWQLTDDSKAHEIGNAIENVMYWFGRSRVQTDEECYERLQEFFDHCMENCELLTVEKMAIALGITRKTLCEWEKGSKGQARAIMIQEAKEAIAASDAELVLRGVIDKVPYIFRAKNYYGLVEAQAVVIQTDNQILGEAVDSKTIETKYVAALPAPTE